MFLEGLFIGVVSSIVVVAISRLCTASKGIFEPHDEVRHVKHPTGTIVIHGASDDLMEFEGDFRDEGNPSSSKPNFIFLSDGSVIECNFTGDDGEYWPLKVIKLGEGTIVKEHRKGDDEDTPDTLTLSRSSSDPFKWFDIWSSADGPTKNELVEELERLDVDWGDFELQDLLEVYKKVKRRK